MRIRTLTQRAVTSAVLGAVLVTGSGAASQAASPAGPVARSASVSAVTVVPVATTATAGAVTSALGGSAVTLAVAGESGALGLPSLIVSFVKKALSYLGKSWTWLKNVVSQGYQAFLTYFWNKIPGWIKTVVEWAYTAWEIYSALRDYFF